MYKTQVSIIFFSVFQLSMSGQSLVAGFATTHKVPSSELASQATLVRSTGSLSNSFQSTNGILSAQGLEHGKKKVSPFIKKNKAVERDSYRRKKRCTPDVKTESLSSAIVETNATVSVDLGSKTGEATYYAPGLGACGKTDSDTSMIAAASQLLFDTFPGATANPNLNPICGRKVMATYEGKSVEVTIVDRCVGCAINDLDLSPSAFSQLAPMEKGRLHGMTWKWA